MKGIILFHVLLTIFHCQVIRYVAASGTIEDLTRLMEDVFANYSRELRPAKNLENAVYVNTSFFLLFVLDVNEVTGSISLSGGINMLWTDFRLEWRPSDYGGIFDMMVNSSKIWTPNIFLISSSADMEKFSFQDFDARILSNGYVLASSGKMIKSSCTVDMTHFPSDTQRCSLIILPWGYLYTEIQLSYIQPTFQMEYFNENGEWNVDSTSVERYKGFGREINALSYTLVLSRKSTYFILSTTVPVYIICVLNPFVFLLPASSGERISYTITMFLSLAVYMTLIGDNMPKVSEPMAGISYFLLVAMMFSCLQIILTIFTLGCDAKRDVKQFPKWLRRLVFRIKKRKAREKTNNIKPLAEDGTDENKFEQNNESAEDSKKEHFRNDMTDPEKSEVTNFIDKTLIVITEITVVGLIFGFTLVYNR